MLPAIDPVRKPPDKAPTLIPKKRGDFNSNKLAVRPKGNGPTEIPATGISQTPLNLAGIPSGAISRYY